MAELSEAGVTEILRATTRWYTQDHYVLVPTQNVNQRQPSSDAEAITLISLARTHASARLTASAYGEHLVTCGIKVGNSEERTAVTLYCAGQYFGARFDVSYQGQVRAGSTHSFAVFADEHFKGDPAALTTIQLMTVPPSQGLWVVDSWLNVACRADQYMRRVTDAVTNWRLKTSLSGAAATQAAFLLAMADKPLTLVCDRVAPAAGANPRKRARSVTGDADPLAPDPKRGRLAVPYTGKGKEAVRDPPLETAGPSRPFGRLGVIDLTRELSSAPDESQTRFGQRGVEEILGMAERYFHRGIKGDKVYLLPSDTKHYTRNALLDPSRSRLKAHRALGLTGSTYGEHLVTAHETAADSKEMASVVLYFAQAHFAGRFKQSYLVTTPPPINHEFVILTDDSFDRQVAQLCSITAMSLGNKPKGVWIVDYWFHAACAAGDYATVITDKLMKKWATNGKVRSNPDGKEFKPRQFAFELMNAALTFIPDFPRT
jgi:hypothetical protein